MSRSKNKNLVKVTTSNKVSSKGADSLIKQFQEVEVKEKENIIKMKEEEKKKRLKETSGGNVKKALM